MAQVRELHVWSTPERRLGSKSLDPIPTEVYLEILSYFSIPTHYYNSDTREILCRLGLVCRFFRSFALPMVFNAVYINGNSMSGFAPFFLSVYRGNDPISLNLCQHVQRIILYTVDLDSPAIPSSDAAPTPLFGDLICHVALRTPNISVFRLFQTTVTPHLIKTLSSLSKLTSLVLRSVRVSEAISKKDLEAFASSVQLESLDLYDLGTNIPGLIPLATQSHLTQLSLDWAFVTSLAAAEVMPPLQHLVVYNVEDLTGLHSFLLRIPTLVSLKLDHVEWPDYDYANRTEWSPGLLAPNDGTYPLPLSPFLNLRRLECPLHLVYLYTGPHTLEAIHFNGTMYSNIPQELLEFSVNAKLLVGSVNHSLREIKFSYEQDGFVFSKAESRNLRDWIPCLNEISFYLPDQYDEIDQDRLEELKKVFSAFLEVWGSLDTLTSLRVENVETDDIGAFRDLVVKHLNIKKYFPKLVTFTVNGVVYGLVYD